MFSRAFVLLALFFAALGLLADFHTAAGFWAFAFFGPASAVFYVLAALSLAAGLGVRDPLLGVRGRFFQSLDRSLHRRVVVSRLTGAGLAAGFVTIGVVLLWFFRQRLFLGPPEGLGDSVLILEHVPVYARFMGYLDSFDELLVLFLRSKFYLWSSTHLDLHIEESYAVVSTGAFVLYAALILWFLRGRTLAAWLCGLTLFVFAPGLQLFAGYVEHYTLPSVYLSMTLFFAARCLEEEDGVLKNQPLLAVTVTAALAAITALHHMITAAMAPALVYFVWLLARRDANDNAQDDATVPYAESVKPFLRLALRAMLAAGPILLLTWAYFLYVAEPRLAFGDSHAASPPVHRPSTLFSLAHARDMVNLLFLAAPAVPALLLVLLALPGRTPRDFVAAPVLRFALLATMLFAGITFIVKSLIGFPGDWDLLTFFRVPLSLYAFYLLQGLFRSEDQARRFVVSTALPLLFVLSATFTAAWIGRNALVTVSPRVAEESRRNLSDAHRHVDLFFEVIGGDPVYAELAERYPDRRKLYILVKLFLIRSEERVKTRDFSDADRAELLPRLEAAGAEFSRWILMPKDEHGTAHRAVWDRLTELNLRINGRGGDPPPE